MKTNLFENVKKVYEYEKKNNVDLTVFNIELEGIFEDFFKSFINDNCFLSVKMFNRIYSATDCFTNPNNAITKKSSFENLNIKSVEENFLAAVINEMVELITNDYSTYFYNLTDDTTRDKSTCSKCENCRFMNKYRKLNENIENLIDSNKEIFSNLTDREISKIVMDGIRYSANNITKNIILPVWVKNVKALYLTYQRLYKVANHKA
jgi:hypothetical protein